MKAFWKVLKRFAAPYKKYLGGSIILNLLSAVFNIFSFALLIPILNILFKLDTNVYEVMPWGTGIPLLILGLIFGGMTLLKTSCYFASSAVMIPLRTGIVRDIRTMVYNKLLSLPMGFFSKQKKGDIIARMSGDVTEIEGSIVSSLDMLIKNPILNLLLRRPHIPQLGADPLHHLRSPFDGLGNGCNRKETQEAIP